MSASGDEELVGRARDRALARRRRHPLDSCVTVIEGATRLHERIAWFENHPGSWSVGHGKAEARDTAAMARFFGSLKEACGGNTSYASHEEARLALCTSLEVYSHRLRRHWTRGYVSPLVSEQRTLQQAKENV